jgi:hypothetical protein
MIFVPDALPPFPLLNAPSFLEHRFPIIGQRTDNKAIQDKAAEYRITIINLYDLSGRNRWNKWLAVIPIQRIENLWLRTFTNTAEHDVVLQLS